MTSRHFLKSVSTYLRFWLAWTWLMNFCWCKKKNSKVWPSPERILDIFRSQLRLETARQLLGRPLPQTHYTKVGYSFDYFKMHRNIKEMNQCFKCWQPETELNWSLLSWPLLPRLATRTLFPVIRPQVLFRDKRWE